MRNIYSWQVCLLSVTKICITIALIFVICTKTTVLYPCITLVDTISHLIPSIWNITIGTVFIDTILTQTIVTSPCTILADTIAFVLMQNLVTRGCTIFIDTILVFVICNILHTTLVDTICSFLVSNIRYIFLYHLHWYQKWAKLRTSRIRYLRWHEATLQLFQSYNNCCHNTRYQVYWYRLSSVTKKWNRNICTILIDTK